MACLVSVLTRVVSNLQSDKIKSSRVLSAEDPSVATQATVAMRENWGLITKKS